MSSFAARTADKEFQSRNREAFGFKEKVSPGVLDRFFEGFQSRNREAFGFK